MPELQELHLDNNRISYIPEGKGAFESLKKLYISNNPIGRFLTNMRSNFQKMVKVSDSIDFFHGIHTLNTKVEQWKFSYVSTAYLEPSENVFGESSPPIGSRISYAYGADFERAVNVAAFSSGWVIKVALLSKCISPFFLGVVLSTVVGLSQKHIAKKCAEKIQSNTDHVDYNKIEDSKTPDLYDMQR